MVVEKQSANSIGRVGGESGCSVCGDFSRSIRRLPVAASGVCYARTGKRSSSDRLYSSGTELRQRYKAQ